MSDEEDSEYGNNLYLGEVFGEIITSGNNQNIICLVEAKQGKGKSWGAMSLAFGASVQLASKLGGIPSDYFNINNVGIIMPDAIADVIINMKKLNTLGYFATFFTALYAKSVAIVYTVITIPTTINISPIFIIVFNPPFSV